MKETTSRTPRSRRWIPLALVSLVVLIVGGLVVPWPLEGYPSNPHPGFDYAQSLHLAQGLDAGDAATMNPLCRVQLMTHGSKAERAIVLVHGYTNCPEQFRLLGEQLYILGYNVLIAPLPYHGLSDRLTDEISQLTAADLTGYADRVIDIAHGLGDQVDMAGLSAGGVVTAWAAQNRSDLRLAVVISPAFGFKQVPTALTLPAMNLMSILPESYSWWDPSKQIQTEPSYAYPRYSLHGLMQIVRVGFAVQMSAARTRPAAGKIVVVTNGNEPSVNNELTGLVAANWQAHGADLVTYEFPASLGLPHDLIDPAQPDQQTGVVYPVLLRLIVGERATGVGSGVTRR